MLVRHRFIADVTRRMAVQYGAVRSHGRTLAVLGLLCGAMLVAPALAEASLDPVAEFRARQEVFLRSWHFGDQHNRNWIRLRSRAGLRLAGDQYLGELVLNNEHRHDMTSDGTAFHWDELIIEQAFLRWQAGSEISLTMGRQNIVWPGGFLMFDGNPMDGSRSMYHNALRLQAGRQAKSLDGSSSGPLRGGVDVALIYNPKRDPLVIIDDRKRGLCDADEAALAMRMIRGAWAWSLLYKVERDPDRVMPDLATMTVAARRDGDLGRGAAPGKAHGGGMPSNAVRWHVEVALQHQDGRVAAATRSGSDLGLAGWALAGDAAATWQLDGGWQVEGGAFYYSGPDGNLRPFRTPWGRWPKWSDLYIYSLMGESTPGREHVAAWENIAAPYLTVTRSLGDGLLTRRLAVSLNATWLKAPAPNWGKRGMLTRSTLKLDISPRLQGHLLWEMLRPGAFHDGRYDLPPLTAAVHFLRWQLGWSL